MKETEATLIGGWIADILSDISNTTLQAEVKAKAKALTAQFPVP
jgi:glycine/serine hydroxymethyltransferase